MRKRRNPVFGLLRNFIMILIIVAIPLAAFGYIFQLQNVEVLGSIHYEDGEIRDRIIGSGTGIDKNTILLYYKHKYFQDTKIPFIEKYDMEIINFNTVKIHVYEKKIIGVVEFMGEYMYFDKDGMIIESSMEHFKEVPLIKGLKYNEIILNEKLEVQKDELYNVILELTHGIDKHNLDVESIVFNSNYEVDFYCGGNRVLLGRKDVYDQELADLKGILAEIVGMELTIDMRRENYIVAKPKES